MKVSRSALRIDVVPPWVTMTAYSTGGADVRTRLLISVGVVYLRHFFRGFKTAGEGPIYELHGGDPCVV